MFFLTAISFTPRIVLSSEYVIGLKKAGPDMAAQALPSLRERVGVQLNDKALEPC